MHTTLLCTFTNRSHLDRTLSEILGTYRVAFGKVYVLSNTEHADDLYCTYNAETSTETRHADTTIPLSRKKQTNTLYTINALNLYVKSHTGNVDKSFVIDWEPFRNSILLNTCDNEKKHASCLRVIRTKLFKIVEFNGTDWV